MFGRKSIEKSSSHTSNKDRAKVLYTQACGIAGSLLLSPKPRTGSPARPFFLQQQQARRKGYKTFAQTDMASIFGGVTPLALAKGPPSVTAAHSKPLKGPFPSDEDEKILAVKMARFYKSSFLREKLVWLLYMGTFGVLYILLLWLPTWKVKLLYEAVSCDDPTAEYVLIQAADGCTEIVEVMTLPLDSHADEEHETTHFGDVSALSSIAGDGWIPLNRVTRGQSQSEHNGDYRGPVHLRMFNWRYERFFALDGVPGWSRLSFGLSKRGHGELHSLALKQLNTPTSRLTKCTFGPNLLDLEVESLVTILGREVTTPFTVFQFFSVIVWLGEGYITFAIVIIVITTLGLLQEALQVRRNQLSLQLIAGTQVEVERCAAKGDPSGKTQTLVTDKVMSADLTPGDIILIKTGDQAPCDLVLLAGQLVVSEANLTGESAPVVKYALPVIQEGSFFDPGKHSRHLILSGTQVLQSKPPGASPPPGTVSGKSIWTLLEHQNESSHDSIGAYALVVGTGASTAKGKLIRAIKHPQSKTSHSADQTNDSYAFLLILAAIAIAFCFWYILYAVATGDQSTSKIINRCLDIITVMVPASLPLALTVGVARSLKRLSVQSIFCISPDYIVSAGHVDTVCYDKTGTLTREGDTLVGIIPSNSPTLSSKERLFHREDWGLTKTLEGSMVPVMAACHSLEPLHATGELLGESLELEMFKATGWTLINRPAENRMAGSAYADVVGSSQLPSFCQAILIPPPEDRDHPALGVLRVFSFDNDTRLMSVIAQPLHKTVAAAKNKKLLLLTKGAPESIAAVCNRKTIPPGFEPRLKDMASRGYRVLACASKELNMNADAAAKTSQSAIEKDMTFAGFLVMGNLLKPETPAVLEEVSLAGLRQCMITGDNVLTAVAVAKDSNVLKMWDPAKQSFYIEKDPEAHVQGSKGSAACIVLSAGAGIESATPMKLSDLLGGGEGEAWLSSVSLAVTGAAFSVLYDHHIEVNEGREDWPTQIYSPNFDSTRASPLVLVTKHANIYARATPREKQLIVHVLQKLGHVVAMVGDGANDSFALKQSDAGLSIRSHAKEEVDFPEETIAVPSIAAPFSTSIAHIGAVLILLKEGRAALATSLVSFRYMFLYGVTQFFAVSLLYIRLSSLGSNQFLVADLINTLPLVCALTFTPSAKTLQPGLPVTKLWSWTFAQSLLGHTGFIVLGEAGQLLFLAARPWFDSTQDGFLSQEDTMLFLSSTFLYLSFAVAFSHTYGGFRAPASSNKVLLWVVSILFIFNSALFLVPAAWLQDIFEMVDTIPYSFMFGSYIWALIVGALAILYERKLVPKREEFWFEAQASAKYTPKEGQHPISSSPMVGESQGATALI